MASVRFVLVHSPLVTRQTWRGLAACLEADGCETKVVALDNRAPASVALYQHHLSLLTPALLDSGGGSTFVVGHSGAGNLLALLNPEQIQGYVFLDAIFPLTGRRLLIA